jgi:serine/threonine protein kinase
MTSTPRSHPSADDEGRTGPCPDDLAAEYLDRQAAGEGPKLDEWLARLDDPAQRQELHQLIEAAEGAERLLPQLSEISPDAPMGESAGGDAQTLVRGRYRILEEVGAGGMGRVFAAWDQELKRKVAIKTLAALDAADEERRTMFLRESHLLAAMQHPNIVGVHEAGTEDGRTFIVMDLVDGRSLADVIAHARKELEVRTTDTKLVPRDVELWERAIDKPIPEGRVNLLDSATWYESAGRIALELARTLEAAHARGVLHRDLKPQNVMLLGGGNPVVLDFGLGGTIDATDGAVTQGLYGSVAYLAPEQVETYRVGNDPRTDVYQLGLVLYEMLTMRRAFPGQSMAEVLEHIKTGQYKPPRAWNSAIPRALAAICAMALEIDPERRYATAAAMREDLERAYEGNEDPVALRASRLRALARRVRWRMRQHPVWSAIAGMLLVGLLAAYVTDLYSDEATEVHGVRVDAESVELLRPNDLLRVGDTLGIAVTSKRPVYMHALWVYEEEAGDRWVEPVRLETAHDEDQRIGDWGVRLAAGKGRSALCGTVESTTTELLGVIAWTAASECPGLDDYLTQIVDLGDRVYGGGVPYDTAREMLAGQPGGPRGVPVRNEADEKDYQAKLEALRKGAAQGTVSPWTLPGAEARELQWRVGE